MASLTPRDATRADLARLRELSRAAVRRERGTCLVEGPVLLGEALDAGCRVTQVACAAEELVTQAGLLKRALAAGAELIAAPAERLVKLADRRHGPALLAEVLVPAAATPTGLPSDGPALVVVLCGLQDPGNVGTLLRSSRAFAASACLCLPGTADLWSPKVVRASAGTCFALPSAALPDEAGWEPWRVRGAGLELCRAEPPALVGTGPGTRDAAPHARAARERDVTSQAPLLPRRCLLLLGHETRGPTAAGRAVCVAQAPGVDSLNVAMAGSILLADWYRTWGR